MDKIQDYCADCSHFAFNEEIGYLFPGLGAIILCTGFSETVNKENAGAFGIKGFLMKPLLISEMAKMARKVLDDAKESSQ